MRLSLIAFLGSFSAALAQYTLTPGTATIRPGGTQVLTASPSATFSLSGAGSISPGSGTSTTYTAPANLTPGGTLHGCPLFPANNVFNLRVDSLPLMSNNAAMMAYIVGQSTTSGFGFSPEPINLVDGSITPFVNAYWTFNGAGSTTAPWPTNMIWESFVDGP